MKQKTIFGLLALMIVGLVASTSLVSAYRGDYSVKGPNNSEERHEAMEDAFESLDYDAWYALMTEDGRHPRVVDVVTESNFATFAEAHEAGEKGDTTLAAELRAQLGLNNGNGPKDGTGFGKSQGMGQGQRMQKNNVADADNDGNCNNAGLGQGRGRK
jgi:hypothetical protein